MYRCLATCLAALAIVAALVACATTSPAAPPPAAPASAGGAPSSPGAAPKSAVPAVDADVRQVYDAFIKQEIPGLPIELVQAAKREGSVAYYHGAVQGFPQLIRAFNERVPFVKAQGFELTGAALAEKFRSEEAAGRHIADVWWNSSAPAADEMVKLGFAMDYTLTSAAKYPKDSHDPGRWYPTTMAGVATAWNTKLVPDADAKRVLATWKGLADPYWQGKTLGYLDFRSGGVSQATNWAFLKEYGMPFWEAMAKHTYNFYNSGAPMSDALAAGEIALAAFLTEAQVYPRWKAGAPIHYSYSSPFIAVSDAQLISKNAPHPNAAKLLHEFVFSRMGQQIMVDSGRLSYRDDVKDQRDVTKEPWFQSPGKPYPIDRHGVTASLNQMGRDYDRLFKKR